MGLYEQLSGARMHASFILPGGIAQEIPATFMEELLNICESLGITLNIIDDLLTFNRI